MDLFDNLNDSAPGSGGDRQRAGAGMTYYPTLLVGLGGTGAEVLLRVKRLLAGRDDGRQSLHSFLFVDTDRSTFSQKPGYPKIAQAEQCLIGTEQVPTLIAYPDAHPHIWKRFPKNRLQEGFIRNLAQGKGAGQIRSLGALALVLDYAQVKRAFANAFNQLIEVANRVNVQLKQDGAAIGNSVVIYVVGSLNGGTGSGCFLDVSLLAHDVCSGRDPRIVGMFALPNASFDEAVKQDTYQQNRIRANAFAALRELQFVLDRDAPERTQAIEYDYGDGGILSLEPADQLFDRVYLVDDQNALGRLSKIDDLYELMARTIFQDVGSPFGTNGASFDANNHVLTGVEPCPITNRPRLLGTVATSSLVFPAERTSLYCTYRLLADAVADQLLGALPAQAEIEGTVTAFLQQERLDDRGSNNQILDSLLFDGARNEVTSASSLGLTPTWGKQLGGAEFAAKIGQQWQLFTTTDLKRVQDLAAGNLNRRLGRDLDPPRDLLSVAVDQFALGVAERFNAASARRLLEELQKVIKQVRDELGGELNGWVTRERQASLQDFNARRDQLANLRFPLFRSKDNKTLRALLINLFNDMATQELWAVARPLAIDLLDKLSHLVQTAMEKWRSLTEDLVRLQHEADAARRGLETHHDTPANRFAVEQEVTPAGYEQRYYEGLRQSMPTPQALAKIVEAFGDRQAMYRWLLGLSPAARMAQAAQKLGKTLYDVLAPPLLGTSIVDFIAANPDEVTGELEAKLSLAFQLCQPFWDAPAVKAGMGFPEFMAVSVAHSRAESGALVAPAAVLDWIKKLARGRDRSRYEVIPSDRRYELSLGRRTYGARCYYLSEAKRWRAQFEQESKSANGRFMIETHAAFLSIPDIFPEDATPLSLFALGMAFGFVVKRGDWYYFGLEESQGTTTVLYSTQAPTVFSIANPPGTPANVGDISFKLSSAKPAKLLSLAQGREAAVAALRTHPTWLDLLGATIEAYHEQVGNATLDQQLRAYVTQVLDESATGNDLLARERALINARLASLGR